MSNAIREQRINEHRGSEKDMELMRREIREKLDEELAKPAGEMDLERIDALLDELGIEGPSQEQQAQWMAGIEREIRAHRIRKAVRVLGNVAAAIVAVIALFFLSFESARAFQWTHLLKILTPVAETFGIYSTSSLDSEPSLPNKTAYTDEDTEYSQRDIYALEEMPVEKDGFSILPKWIPERFSFMQGAIYEDPDMAEFSASYRAGEDILVIRMMLSYNDDSVFSYEYERTASEPLTEEIEGRALSYYTNTDSDRLSASWIEQDAHYQISGNITYEELKQIVGSMME